VELRQDGTVLVELRISNDERIPSNSTAKVIPVGIFGDVAVALDPERPSTTFYVEGDTVPAGKPTPTIQDIIARMDTVGLRVSDMTSAIELQLVQRGGIQDLRQAIANTNSLILQLNAVAAEQSRQLSMTQAALRRSVSAIDSASVDSTVRNLRTTSANMAELTSNLRQTTAQLNAVLAKLEGTDGTAGKLLNDPQLYNDLRSLVTRVDSLTADFKKNPRRYINLEIF
jgi:phospholipid/cholesterol/gamma-HCH transport system substrate-binding protein